MSLGHRCVGIASRGTPCPLGCRKWITGYKLREAFFHPTNPIWTSWFPPLGSFLASAGGRREGCFHQASHVCPFGIGEQAQGVVYVSLWADASFLDCVPVYLEVTLCPDVPMYVSVAVTRRGSL